MKKELFVKGCIIFMLFCVSVTGCGVSDARQEEPVVTEEVTEEVTEDTEEITEDISEESDTEASTIIEDSDQEEAVTQNSGELSDDLYSYQVLINGEIYQVPMDVETLVERGWELEESMDEELEAYTSYPLRTFYNGDCQIQVTIVNETDSPKSYRECRAVAISVSLFYNYKGGMTFILPKGIQSGVSTLEDMKAAYGEPTRLSESDQVVLVYYEIEYATKEITFTFNENKLKEIRIINKDF
ncbi:MAG: hypothetical protein K2J90_03105 [Lachnospiraceae bacterium]|nr:hypothetical protein [Lachnospiraceae bacterium]